MNELHVAGGMKTVVNGASSSRVVVTDGGDDIVVAIGNFVCDSDESCD